MSRVSIMRQPTSLEIRSEAANLDYCRECGARAADVVIARCAPSNADDAALVQFIGRAIGTLPEAMSGMASEGASSHAVAAFTAGWADVFQAFLNARAEGMSHG